MKKKIIFTITLGTILFSCAPGKSLIQKKALEEMTPRGDSVSSNEVTNEVNDDGIDAENNGKAEITPTQTTDKKYWVVAVAGQSNSVGYDESFWDDSFRENLEG